MSTSGVKITYQLQETGGFQRALSQFEGFIPTNIVEKPCGRIGDTRRWGKIIIRNMRTSGRPTLEFQIKKTVYFKVRYDD